MRVPAGELEQRYKLKHLLLDFTDKMSYQMYRNLREKGFSWKTCTRKHLIDKLIKNLDAENWVDIANYAFMLDERSASDRRKRTAKTMAKRIKNHARARDKRAEK